jgi:CBS domain-containing protein
LRLTGLKVVSKVDMVSDVMTGWVVTIPPSDSLLQARDQMTRSRVSQLVVVDHRNRPIGLISKRDIARFLLEDSTTRPVQDINVSEATSKSIPTVRPDFSVFNAARMFDTENLSYAVVTGEPPLSGIMTETDLCHYFSRKWPGKFQVRDVASRDFIFAKSSYPVVHVAQAIVYKQPSVPVIDEELVGILTLSDLLSIRERVPGAMHGRLFVSKSETEVALIRTEGLMTRNPITTLADADLAQAAQVIITSGIGSLPAIDNEKKVVGLLTKHDIVRALGRIGRSMAIEG